MKSINNKFLDPWTIKKSVDALSTPWFSIKKYSCTTPLGKDLEYYVHEAPDSVMCVCVTKDGLIPVVRQFRFPMNKVSLDYPAGYVESSDSDIKQAAIREVFEETGYKTSDITHIFSLAKDPSLSRGKMHVFLAKDVEYLGSNKKDDELIVTELMSPKKIIKAIEGGEMSCAFCIATTLRVAHILDWNIDLE